MFRMQKTTATMVLVVGAILAAKSVIVAGEGTSQVTSDAAVIVPGSYKPVGWWDRVKLSGAYFTNSQAAKDTVVVYGFDPKAISCDSRLLGLVKGGNISLGMTNTSNSISVMAPAAVIATYPTKEALCSVVDDGKTTIVAPSGNLLGATVATPLVKVNGE